MSACCPNCGHRLNTSEKWTKLCKDGSDKTIVSERQASLQKSITSRQSLAELTQEIEQIRGLLDELESCHTNLSSFAKAHDPNQSSYCHIGSLPPEILALVFDECANEDGMAFLGDNMVSYLTKEYGDRVIPVPFILSQVCQHWREVVNARQNMWSKFAFQVNAPTFHSYRLTSGSTSDFFRRQMKKVVDPILVCLERSGNYPLFIQVDTLLLSGKEAAIFIDPILVHTERIRSLEIHVDFESLETFRKAKFRFHQLRNLSISFSGSKTDVSADDLDVFSTAPQLTSVRVDRHLSLPLVFPWKQLETYIGSPPQTLFNLLSSDQENMTLPTISNMDIAVSDGYAGIEDVEATCRNLTRLDLPALQELSIHRCRGDSFDFGGHSQWNQASLRHLSHFIQRHSLTLNVLRIREPDVHNPTEINAVQFCQLVRRAVNVKCLYIPIPTFCIPTHRSKIALLFNQLSLLSMVVVELPTFGFVENEGVSPSDIYEAIIELAPDFTSKHIALHLININPISGGVTLDLYRLRPLIDGGLPIRLWSAGVGSKCLDWLLFDEGVSVYRYPPGSAL